MFLKIFIVIISITINEAIIGFDCGTSDPAVKTYSLLDAGECNFNTIKVNTTNTTIQLLQIAEFSSIKVIHCKIEIKRTVSGCGWFSHLYAKPNAIQEYVVDLSYEKCKFIHETGIYKYDNFHTIADLKINSTKSTGLDLAGSVTEKKCTGAAYADRFGSWSNVIVQGTIKITLLEQFAQVNLNDDKILLNSGTVCKFSEQHCLDLEAGHSFWSPTLNNDCFKNKYNILYQGPATKTTSENRETIFSLVTDEISFSLEIRENIKICSRILTRTEHPRLYIYEKNTNNILFEDDNSIRNRIGVFNIDMFTYINSKFVHIERHFRIQSENLYLQILKEKCELERKVIQNSLSLASIAPDEFAYNLMQKPGYIAKLAGEVVHVIKCTPIETEILHLNNCYAQLPVTAKNQTYFLTAKTHILLKSGMEINCNSIIPHYFKIGNTWITLTPKPRKITTEVKTFNPSTELKWKAEKLESLATSGIYNQEDLQEFRKHILFPMEKAALINVIARGMEGEKNEQENLITNLLTENTLKHIAENTWNNFIEKLTTFGSISSAIIMILIILQTIKLIIDTVIRGYTLHRIYGWSLHLFAAIFSSITHLLTMLNQQTSKERQTRNKKQLYEETELHNITITRPPISYPIQPPPIPDRPPVIKISETVHIDKKQLNKETSNNHVKKEQGLFSLD